MKQKIKLSINKLNLLNIKKLLNLNGEKKYKK